MSDMKLPSNVQVGDPVCIFGHVSGVRFTEGKVRYDVGLEDGTACDNLDSCFVALAARNSSALEAVFTMLPIAEVEEITNLIQAIHQQIKRGATTMDHGRIGNLKCILDHLSPSPDPL